MKTKILGAWAGGVAVGFATAVVVLSNGCIGKARADDVTVVDCKTLGQKAEFTLPDTNPETFARLTVVLSDDAPCRGMQTLKVSSVQAPATDGKVTLDCPSIDCDGKPLAHGAYSFVLR
jgi:hypothetical protein